jgi:type I restriction enzyme, S subunit
MGNDTVIGSIPEEWEYTTLGEACRQAGGDIQTGPFGSQLHAADYVPVGVPSIMPQNIGDNRIVEDGIARITHEDARRLSRYLVKAGDIVYSRRGDVERRALIREQEDGWLCGTGCLRIRFGNSSVDPLFASYYLGHPSVREWIVRHAHGATMPNLNTSILSACPFVIPPFHEQRAIAHILGTLDDKIELNRQMNETLEEITQTIFKSWFIDFDPVRAKAKGREPHGIDSETAALFPDSFEDSELGPIPIGWEIEPIGELVTVKGGGTPSTKESSYWDKGEIPFATPRDLSKLETPILMDTERKITEAGLKRISSGLLPKGTVLLSSRAPIGYLAITDVPLAVNQGFIALICNGRVPNVFALNWLRFNSDLVVGYANGTTFLEISKRNFKPIRLVVPPAKVAQRFVALVQPFYDQIKLNQIQNETLSELRDTLLQPLVTGALRIDSIEPALREVP